MMNISKKPSNNIYYVLPNHKKKDILKKFVVKGNIKGVKEILSSGFEDLPSEDDMSLSTPLLLSITFYNLEIFKLLFKAGSRIITYDRGYSALHHAVDYNRLDLVKFMSDNGVDIDLKLDDGTTPIMHLSRNNIEVVKYLVSKGANINHQNKAGLTVLHSAAFRFLSSEGEQKDKEVEFIKFLINKGIDTSLKDRRRQTAYYLFRQSGRKDIYSLLDPWEK